MRLVPAFLLCFMLPFASFAQAPSGPPAPVLKVTTHLVVLNVVVTDKNGKPVSNLTKDDFVVSENGQRQTIDTLEPPSALPPSTENAPAVALAGEARAGSVAANVAQPRTILVLDELNTISEDTMFAAKEVQRYLMAQPAVLKQPTAMYLLTKRQLQPFVESTRDRNALLARLKTNFIELPPHNLESGGAQGGADRLIASLIALDEIALANAEQKGRKNVIWIGNGIPVLSNANISMDDSAKFRSWVRYTANWLEQTQTTVYTIDPRGVEVSPATLTTGGFVLAGAIPGLPVGPDLTSSELVFEAIAPESGGAILRHRNDIDGAIASAVNDGSSYYTLSYYPTDRNWDGKFRQIQIKLESSGLVARTQRGYYAFADGVENNGEQLDWSISRAVTSPLLFNGIGFTATGQRVSAGPVNDKNSKNAAGAARVLLAVNRDSLSWTTQPNGDERSEVTLVTSEMSSSGHVLGYHVREVEVVVEKSKLGRGDPLKLTLRTELPAKTDHIRLVLRDASSGRLGTFDLPAAQLIAANVSSSR
jgi:VWFA-related protein